MKKVLVLGAGLIARPLIRYLLDQPEFEVEVADVIVSKAAKIIDNHPRGTAKELNLKIEESLRDEISKADIVVSIVPYTFHAMVAKYCIEFKKHMVTTSYVSPEMNDLDQKAKEAGILILNELGLDPGLDHMEAMRIIHEIEEAGGQVESFTSFCGGLPAPEANTNPFGYKFSWSPIGVLRASKNQAKYLKDGQQVLIPSEDLFNNYSMIKIEELGDFEGYPNRDSIPYIEIYGIPSTKTMLRGTLRNIDWCQTLKKIGELGLLDEEEKDWTGLTYKEFMRKLMNAPSDVDVKKAMSEYLRIEEDSDVMGRLEWLGLLSDDLLAPQQGSAMGVLGALMIEKLKFDEGERDMIVLQHELVASCPGDRKEKITSTLIDYGIPHGDSSMARTVGLTAAIGTRMVLEGKITSTGVHIPIVSDIYIPILSELKKMRIAFEEKKEDI